MSSGVYLEAVLLPEDGAVHGSDDRAGVRAKVKGPRYADRNGHGLPRAVEPVKHHVETETVRAGRKPGGVTASLEIHNR